MKVPNKEEFEYMYWLAERIIESDFFNYDSLYDWGQDWENYFADNYGVTLEFGCTKACFISTDSEWVIKLNTSDMDYCHDEAENYQRAVIRGIDECFAACYFLDHIGGYDFYIQEKVDVDEETTDSTCYTYASRQCNSDDYDDINELYWDMDDYERIIALFEDSIFKTQLLDFIDTYNINDLHVGNFGYRNNSPVLMDYSGY